MDQIKGTKSPILMALALGVIGGAALIITIIITSKGPAIFIPYTGLLIAIFASLRAVNWPSQSKRFTTSFIAFMVATIMLYLFIGIYDAGTILEISVWGHIWRLGLMSAFGSALSFAVSYLADVGQSQLAY